MNVRCDITAEPLDANAFSLSLAAPGHGAVTVFFGVVRDENLGRSVVAVSYDAHPALARRVLVAIAEEAAARAGASVHVHAIHRTGRLVVGEASVAIGVSTPHRAEAFDAARYVIEEIKKRLPVWKKEHYADGDSEWLRGHALCGAHPGGGTQPADGHR